MNTNMPTACVEEKIHKGSTYPRKRDSQGLLRPTHRINWIAKNGPIPDMFVLHHVCENKACVNPDHLVLVHNDDHFYEFHHRVCRNGRHAMEGSNIVWWGRHRRCRACATETARRAAAALRNDPERLKKRQEYRRLWMQKRRQSA